MRWTGEVACGDWIRERLEGWGLVGGVVPCGFEAYARIFHPPDASRHNPADSMEFESREVCWRDVAEVQGTTWHPAAQWGALSGSRNDEVGLGDGWSAGPPEQGHLRLDLLASVAETIAQHTSDLRVTIGVWEGWGELHPGTASSYLIFHDSELTRAQRRSADKRMRAEGAAAVSPDIQRALKRGPLLQLPHRAYALLSADLQELTNPEWVYASGLGWRPRSGLGWRNDHGALPNLIWPQDRSWLLASEIDFDSTLVGGSRELIDALIRQEGLEVAEVTERTDLTFEADSINPPAHA